MFVEVTSMILLIQGLDLSDIPWRINIDEVGERIEEILTNIETNLSRRVNLTTGEIESTWKDKHIP